MPAKMSMTIPFTRTVTAEEVAQLFCELNNYEHAEFFNAVAALSDSWPSPFCFQLQAMVDSCKLNAGGRAIMRDIGEYADSAVPVVAQVDPAACDHQWHIALTASDAADGWVCLKCGERREAK